MSSPIRPDGRQRRCPEMNTLSAAQKQRFGSLIRTYRCDLDDPPAVEVLTVLLEVCKILDMLPGEVERLFSRPVLHTLRRRDEPIVYGRGRLPRPPQLHRVWVWLPDGGDPQLRAVADDGTAQIYPKPSKRTARQPVTRPGQPIVTQPVQPTVVRKEEAQ